MVGHRPALNRNRENEKFHMVKKGCHEEPACGKAFDLFTNIGKEGFFTKLNGMIERNGSAGNWKQPLNASKRFCKREQYLNGQIFLTKTFKKTDANMQVAAERWQHLL